MKKTIAMVVTLVLSQMVSFGQSWSLGAAGIYGDDIENVGIHLRGYYNLKNNKICFGPEFSYFLTADEIVGGEPVEKKLNEWNFNFHYIIELNEKWGVYPLSGLNVSFEKETVLTGPDQGEHSISEFGVNVGFGIHRAVNKWVIFSEYDHLFSELSQNSILLGAFYTFGKSKKE